MQNSCYPHHAKNWLARYMVHSFPMKPEGVPAGGEVTAVFKRVFQTIRPRSACPEVEVRFVPFANANSFIQLKHGRLEARIADLLQTAPANVLEALAFLLIGKLFRKEISPVHQRAYRQHLETKPVRLALSDLRQARGHKQIASPQGDHFDLIEVFEKVNFEYFHGLMPRPDLGWSRRHSRYTLGHYDAAHHTIVISRTLDSPSTPSYVVEFVMYHEMLHIKFPAEQRGAKRCVHTPEFQRAEREFARYEDVRRFLRG